MTALPDKGAQTSSLRYPGVRASDLSLKSAPLRTAPLEQTTEGATSVHG